MNKYNAHVQYQPFHTEASKI